MQACRLTAEELTPKLPLWQILSESARALCSFGMSHTGDLKKGRPYIPRGGILTHPGDPGMVCSRRKQWGREVISGYSLTGEKCTVREPRQSGSKAVCTVLLKCASRRESSSVSALSILNVWVQESGHHPTEPHHTAALQSMSVSPPLLHTWQWLMIRCFFGGKNVRRWNAMIWELRELTESWE